MKKVKSFVCNPATILTTLLAAIYLGWKWASAAGLGMPFGSVYVGILAVFLLWMHVNIAFYGVKDTRELWREKQFKSAVFTAIGPTVSIIVLAAMIVLPLLYGLEGVYLGVILLSMTMVIPFIFDIISTMIIVRVADYKYQNRG